jgi:hypothetical protein
MDSTVDGTGMESGALDAIWEYAEASIGAGIGLRLKTGIPNAAPGGNLGLPLVDANNYVAGLQGTKNQLDDLNDVSTAQVNTEVLDVVNVDTFAEIGQEAPAATQTFRKMLGFLYKAWRNKKDSDGTTEKLYNDDAATVDQKRTLAESGGTVTKGEVASGP